MTTTTAPKGAQAPPVKPTPEQLLAAMANVALDEKAPDLREMVADAIELAAMTKRLVHRHDHAQAAMCTAMRDLDDQQQEVMWSPLGDSIGLEYVERLMMASAKAITDTVGLMNRPVTFDVAEEARDGVDFYADLVKALDSLPEGGAA